MPDRSFNQVFELLVRVLPVMHRKIHRDVFKGAIEQTGEDMAPHHLMILKMLRDGGLSTMSEIGEEISISQSQMTHSTDRLIILGMLERQVDALDRRKIHLRLTAKGKECLMKMDSAMRDRLESKLSLLSDSDLKRLSASLGDVAEIFTKIHWE